MASPNNLKALAAALRWGAVLALLWVPQASPLCQEPQRARRPVHPLPAGSTAPFPASRNGPLDRPYNVVLFVTDEEAYHLRAVRGFATPARAELQRRGTTFLNHYIGSAMCTPSRGVMFSGQPPQVNGVFDQMETGYVPSLRTDRPSMGTVFRQLGYRTAYFRQIRAAPRHHPRPSAT